MRAAVGCGSAPRRGARRLLRSRVLGFWLHAAGAALSRPGWAAALRCLRLVRPAAADGATRQHGEPSWHRRARRARGEARVLLRLDAARAKLAAHHSSAFGGMQRQRGGRSAHGSVADGSAGQHAAAKQLLLSLLDGAFGAKQRGKGGGRGPGPAGQQRAGEWACPCGFRTNRPSRSCCFVCQRPRDAGGAQGKGVGPKGGGGKGGDWRAAAPARCTPASRDGGTRYDGPIGANGSRPLLGG